MGRIGATALLMVVLSATAVLAAEIPTGDLVLHGTQRAGKKGKKQDLDGTLSVTENPDGTYSIARSVRATDGSLETLKGVATEKDGKLTLTLSSSDGLASALGGSKAPQATVRAVYELRRDGSLRGKVTTDTTTSDETACTTEDLSKKDYFAFLDRDAKFQQLAHDDALAAFLDLLARKDVPADVDEAYAKKAGTPGGGRVRMALDYTRGFGTQPTWSEAIAKGPKTVIGAEILTPRLTHFRHLHGRPIFAGDDGFQAAFRDSGMTSPLTNQVGHMLCAAESGVRLGYYERHKVKRKAFELMLRMGDGPLGLKGVDPTIEDWSRAGIIGHEMIGDEDDSGFLGQMNTYARLVANGDPDRIRESWDRAVKAVLAGDHVTAWTAIRRIAKASEIPETLAEMEANKLNPHPRFAKPGSNRAGNSLADLALSVYGFALGYRSASTGYPTPAAVRADFEAFLHTSGQHEPAIARAVEQTR